MNTDIEDLKALANGNWFEILSSSGIDESFLKNKPGPCPICGGKDRFRWDDMEERGTYYCPCGPGDGFQLLQRFHNWNFSQAAQFIENRYGNDNSLKAKKPAEKKTDPKRAQSAREFIDVILQEAKPIESGDQASQYLESRGIYKIPQTLLFHPKLYDVETKKNYAGMVAPLTSIEGEIVRLHRTFLENGTKADIDSPRKKTASIEPDKKGEAIRLYEVTGNRLGIAEGIETAIAAHELYPNVPVWSVMDTAGMKNFIPPPTIEHVAIFGDNDKNYAGHAAAYELAHKLSLRGIKVDVLFPTHAGTDYLDVWNDIQEREKKIVLENNKPPY